MDKEEKEGLTLAQARAGVSLYLLAIKGAGRELRARLVSMGLVPGVILKIMRKGRHGQCIVAVKGVRLGLGRGMAQKILVHERTEKHQDRLSRES